MGKQQDKNCKQKKILVYYTGADKKKQFPRPVTQNTYKQHKQYPPLMRMFVTFDTTVQM